MVEPPVFYRSDTVVSWIGMVSEGPVLPFFAIWPVSSRKHSHVHQHLATHSKSPARYWIQSQRPSFLLWNWEAIL